MDFIITTIGLIVLMLAFVAFCCLFVFVLSVIYALIYPHIRKIMAKYAEWFTGRLSE